MGSGAFGEVYLCFDHDTGRELAVKMVKLHGVNAEVSKVRASVLKSVLMIDSEKQIDCSRHIYRQVSYFSDRALSVTLRRTHFISIKKACEIVF